MKFLTFSICMLMLFSCGQNDTKQKELELKEKELALKEKELNLREKDSAKTTPTPESSPQPLILTPLTISGDIGYITFSQNDKTIFYFDAKSKKGKVILNGTEYVLNKKEGSARIPRPRPEFAEPRLPPAREG